MTTRAERMTTQRKIERIRLAMDAKEEYEVWAEKMRGDGEMNEEQKRLEMALGMERMRVWREYGKARGKKKEGDREVEKEGLLGRLVSE